MVTPVVLPYSFGDLAWLDGWCGIACDWLPIETEKDPPANEYVGAGDGIDLYI